MSEVQSRPSAPRGRGSARGGRGGFSSRGGRGPRAQNDRTDSSPASNDDDAGLAAAKKQYGSKATMIKEMFPDWTDEDVVFALQETDGDLELTVEKITDGSITQWSKISKKDHSKPKEKPAPVTESAPRNVRNAQDSGRGGRGRGTDRGRGGRGGRVATVAATNGAHTKPAAPLSVPTEESSAWGAAPTGDSSNDAKPAADGWGATAVSVVETAAAPVSNLIPQGVKKTWASMFKAEPAPKSKTEPKPAPVEKAPEPAEPEIPVQPEVTEPEAQPVETPIEEQKQETEKAPVPEAQPTEQLEETLAPSKDELTETNLEQVLDVSNPTPIGTAASTAANSWDPRSGATSATPYSSVPAQAPGARAIGGFATSALKAAGGRTPIQQRRVLNQEEAVRMPGNREVDRATVQFGAFSLGGAGEEDVDGDREEPETRAQPPQHSPIAQPRASLPPAPVQHQASTESLPAAKEPHGLPAPPTSAPGLPSPLPGAPSMSQQGSQGSYSQYGRYGQSAGQEHSGFAQKPYDPFSQQAPTTQSQYQGFPSQQSQTENQSSGFSSAPSDYSQYYTADQRHAYQNYYGQNYGQQQTGQGGQGEPAQQRPFGGYNAPSTDTSSPFPQSTSQQTQSRYGAAGDAQTSGHTTPNPPAQSQQSAQSAQPQQAQQPQPQGPASQQYPYGNPYYSSPYYAAYMNNYGQYGQGNYGAGPYGKGGMYNQPHQYGMSPQPSYDHTASPAAGAFSQSSIHGRDSAVGGGLGEFGRGASQQSQTAQPLGASGGYGGDSFARGSYQGQSGQYGQGSQQGAADDLKPFGADKSANGPSPSLTSAARPGSAANATPGQSSLPPPQSSQQGFSGYPSHLQQQHNLHGSQTGSQYGGLGGLGQHQTGAHQSSYGGYGQGGFGGSYYGNQQRGGWGNNYQH